MKIEKWLNENTSRLDDKTVVITGATGVLGKQLCSHLASLGAKLVLLNRNLKKSNELKTELQNEFPEVEISVIQADMENFASVVASVEELKKMKIDCLILNAGAFNIPRHKTEFGFDNVFQINFISPYFLARRLLPNLEQSKGKILVVGSIAHKQTKLNTQDIDFSKEKNSQKVYGNSKRFLMFSLFELLKDNKKVSLSVAHPGITLTGITSNYSKILQPIIKLGMNIIYMYPKKASLSIIKGVFEDCEYHTWIGPKCHDIWGYPKKSKLSTCTIKESQEIAKIAEEIYQNLI